MAKSFAKKEFVSLSEISPYGSHSSMICEDIMLEQTTTPETRKIVCEDEKGRYITIIRNVDSGNSDPFRTMSIKERVARCIEHGVECELPKNK